MATGSTMRAAVRAVQLKRARSIIVAAPVASAEAVGALRRDVQNVVIRLIPEELFAIGKFYGDFEQTSDDEVRTRLARAAARLGTGPAVAG